MIAKEDFNNNSVKSCNFWHCCFNDLLVGLIYTLTTESQNRRDDSSQLI